MNERINWMDWAKFLAVALTIPCHIPQELGAQPVTYFEVFLLACLMFNSGYLKKERTNIKEELKKYWHQLGIPYIIYNIVFIPYWLIKLYFEHGAMPTLSESMRPIYGALLLQANNSFAEELNPRILYNWNGDICCTQGRICPLTFCCHRHSQVLSILLYGISLSEISCL